MAIALYYIDFLSHKVIRGFTAKDADDFEKSGVVGPLTISDVQKCILYAMESVHFDAAQNHLPGHDSTRCMKQAPVLSAYREAGLIDTFPLHDEEALAKLYGEWKNCSTLDPPLEQIRDYFGENVALYVSFTSFYTKFLIPIALLGKNVLFSFSRWICNEYYEIYHENILQFSILHFQGFCSS